MKLNNKILFIFTSTILFILLLCSRVNAASASLSASATDVQVGTTVTITTKINGAAWQVNVGGAVSGSYADNTDDAEDTTTTKTLSFTPSSAGTYTVTLNGNVTGGNDTSATNVSDSITINVTEKENISNASEENTSSESNSSTPNEQEPTQSLPVPSTQTPTETRKSSNANLANLGITPNDFRGFKPGTLNYSVTVPNNVEKVNVYAKTQDKTAKITSGTGQQNINVGENSLKVLVTAEDGTEKVYTINVTREEKKEEENQTSNEIVAETTEENKEDSDLIKLEVEGYKITPNFSANIYEYKLNVSDNIESLNVIAKGANENINIEVAGNKEIKEGENLITILVYNNETKKNSTYQILVTKTNAEAENSNTKLNSAVRTAKRNRFIVIGIGLFILICGVIFIIAKNRYKVEDEEDDEDEEDEATEEFENNEKINLNEEEALFRRVNREDFKIRENPTQNKNSIENKKKQINSNEISLKKNNEFEEKDARKKGRHF